MSTRKLLDRYNETTISLSFIYTVSTQKKQSQSIFSIILLRTDDILQNV